MWNTFSAYATDPDGPFSSHMLAENVFVETLAPFWNKWNWSFRHNSNDPGQHGSNVPPEIRFCTSLCYFTTYSWQWHKAIVRVDRLWSKITTVWVFFTTFPTAWSLWSIRDLNEMNGCNRNLNFILLYHFRTPTNTISSNHCYKNIYFSWPYRWHAHRCSYPKKLFLPSFSHFHAYRQLSVWKMNHCPNLTHWLAFSLTAKQMNYDWLQLTARPHSRQWAFARLWGKMQSFI